MENVIFGLVFAFLFLNNHVHPKLDWIRFLVNNSFFFDTKAGVYIKSHLYGL